MCHRSHQSIFLYFVHQYLFPFEFLSISFLVMPSIIHINFSCFKKRMMKGNNRFDCLRRLKKEWRKETTIVIDGDGSSLLDLSLFSLSLLTIYEWRGYHWQNDAIILSLVHLIAHWFFPYFSFPWWVINHTNQFSFTLYINIFPFGFLSIPFWVMSSITPINFSFLEKRMNKGNNRRVMTARHSVW
jgi:predicted membrane protein